MQSKEHRYSKIHNLGTHTFNKGKSQCFLEFLNSQTRRENMLLVPITESQFLGLKQCYSQGSFFDDTLDHGKSKRVPEKHRFLLYWLCQSLRLCGSWITINWKILQEMGIPDHLTCLLRNLYGGQEATVRTGHGTTDWFQIGKEYIKAVYCHPAYLTSM